MILRKMWQHNVAVKHCQAYKFLHVQDRTEAQDENQSTPTSGLKSQRCVGSVKQKVFISPVVFEPHKHKHRNMYTRQEKTREKDILKRSCFDLNFP